MENQMPLTGIKVLDFTRAFVGPSCTQVLGDMGADVDKVESIGYGDFSRHSEVFEETNGEGAAFLSLNRNKRSICIDLGRPEGKEIVLKLVDKCDVVVQNFRPDVMTRLGLDYEVLNQRNPSIIYASGSGYGLTGPYNKKGGQDLVAQAISGITWLSGEPGGPPVPGGAPVGDLIAGMLLVQGVLAALLHRERTGEGQEVSASILDGLLTPHTERATAYLATGRQPPKAKRPLYNFYPTKDDKLVEISGRFGGNALPDVCEVLGLPDLSQDERFNTNDKMNYENGAELEVILSERFLTKTRDEWIKALDEKDVLCGPVYAYNEVFTDPQVLHNEMLLEFDHPRAGKVRTVGMPVKFTKTPSELGLPPPMLGQHTDDILRGLGYSDQDIESLRDSEVVG